MSAYHERKRTLQFFYGTGVSKVVSRSTGGIISQSTRVSDIRGKEETHSRDNTGWGNMRYIRKRHRDGAIPDKRFDSLRLKDIGSTFLNVKHSYYHSHPWVMIKNPTAIGGIRSYSGPQFARFAVLDGNNAVWPTLPSDDSLYSEMLGKGSEAIAKTIPTNPMSSVAQVLGELRERLPAVPGAAILGRKGNVSKKFADEYLNFEFGVKPMVSDLKKIAETATKSRKVLEQLQRDSGRLVRRRYDFPVERTVTEEVLGTGYVPVPTLDTYLYEDRSGVLTRVRTVTKKFWFSGAYTYHVVQGDSFLEQARRAEQSASKLYGTRLNAELLWELTPWSWAVDWVSNLGSVIHNLDAFSRDGLVLRWGYMMCHMTITDTYTLQGVKFVNSPPQTFVQSFTSETKRRIKATPYGFGLEFDAFTPRQIAILTALGISRSGDPK